MLLPFFGESQSLGESLGRRREARVAPDPQGMSQKTYESDFSRPCALTGVCLSQKNGCGTSIWCRSLFILEVFMNNKKLIVIIVAVLALVIGAMAGIYAATRPEAVAGEKNVTVVIVYEDGTEKKLEYATTCESLADLLLEKELVTGYASEEYGFTIESVDGITLDWATDGAYWALYEGDEYATTSAAGIMLTEGGVYRLVYEKF